MKPLPDNRFYAIPTHSEDSPQFPWWTHTQQVRHRPWWRLEKRKEFRVWSRPADPSMWVRSSGGGWRSSLDATIRPPTDLLSMIEAIDRAHPLPPPRICAGQVWMRASFRFPDPSTYAVREAGSADLHGIVKASPKVLWPGGGVSDLHAECFLLFDPCMPHLAPWSPHEHA